MVNKITGEKPVELLVHQQATMPAACERAAKVRELCGKLVALCHFLFEGGNHGIAGLVSVGQIAVAVQAALSAKAGGVLL